MDLLPREPSGSGALVETVRRIIRVLRSRKIIAGKGIRVSEGPNGTVIESTARGGGAPNETTSNVPKWG